ncbi:MAG: hypothetical protein ABW360_01060 [Phenylobacterium sp.]
MAEVEAMTVTDWIQAVSAAVVSILTIFLWRLARHQTNLLDSSVKIAKQSADAAQRSAETAERALIGVQRPFLRVTIGDFRILPPDGHEYEEYRATIRVANIGRETAIIVDSAVQFLPNLAPINPPTPGVDPFDGVWCIDGLYEGVILPPNGDTTFDISRLMDASRGEKISNFSGMRGCLFVYGVIVYDDPIGIRRELGFTIGWSESDKAFFRCSSEGGNYDRVIERGTTPIKYKPRPGEAPT